MEKKLLLKRSVRHCLRTNLLLYLRKCHLSTPKCVDGWMDGLSPLISFYNLIFYDGAHHCPTKGHLQGRAPAFLMHHRSLNVKVDVAPLLLKGFDIKG